MALDNERDHNRTAVQPREATRLPGAPSDTRTIIKRLKLPNSDPRSLQGYVTFDGDTATVPRYHVYVDQFQDEVHRRSRRRGTNAGRRSDDGADLSDLQAKLAQAEAATSDLRATNAALRSQLAGAHQSNEQLLSKLASLEAERSRDKEAIRVLAATNALMADAAEAIQDSAETFKLAGGKALTGAGKYLRASQMQQDLIAQYVTPDDLSDLPPV